MDGYSVTEAASILGVPIERVWELLARGILSGTPEGETGMRVFLQPRPAPAPPVIEARPPNGDSGSREPERELSPFRELLTEFRNLTERYGQALLALGESRGEVAALRSRVDLLEARMDLRLPMSPAPQAATASPWPAPVAAVAPPAEPAENAHVEEAHPESEEHPRRRRGHRRATESFAEALARAEDPTRPELPGAAETAAAMAALRDEAGHDAEIVLPRELPAAEPMPMPEERRDTITEPAVGEPVADEAASEPSAEVAEAVAEDTEPEVAEPERAEPEAAEPEAAEPEAAEDEAAGPGPAQPESAAPDAVETQPAEAEAVEPEPEPEPIAFDPERYTVEIIEPDWYADEDSNGSSVEGSAPERPDAPPVAPESEPESDVEVPAGEAAEPTPWPDEGRAADAPAASAETPDEETMKWDGREPRPSQSAPEGEPAAPVDDGADEMEVVGAAAPRPDSTFPGSRELDDALEALDAVTRPASDPSEGVAEEEWPPAVNAGAPTSMADVWSGGAPESPAAPAMRQPGLLPSVRPQTTPASRAYRRLRRIFPG